MNDNESLVHYGVLGMKWGVRKSGDDYRYTSHSTKTYERKSEKYAAKAGKTTNEAKKAKYAAKSEKNAKKAKLSQQLDDRMLSNVKNTGAATTAYAALTLGGGGMTKTYQMFKAANDKPLAKSKKENDISASAAIKTYGGQVCANILGQSGAMTVYGAAATGAYLAGQTATTAMLTGYAAGLVVGLPMASLGGVGVRKVVRTKYINDRM